MKVDERQTKNRIKIESLVYLLYSLPSSLHLMMNPVTNNLAPARNSFSIENILSKPDRIPQTHLSAIFPIKSSLDSVPRIRSDETRHFCDENANIDETDDGQSEQSESRNSFTTPDSSCCGDGNDDGNDDMNDTASEHNCKWTFLILGNLSLKEDS